MKGFLKKLKENCLYLKKVTPKGQLNFHGTHPRHLQTSHKEKFTQSLRNPNKKAIEDAPPSWDWDAAQFCVCQHQLRCHSSGRLSFRLSAKRLALIRAKWLVFDALFLISAKEPIDKMNQMWRATWRCAGTWWRVHVTFSVCGGALEGAWRKRNA